MTRLAMIALLALAACGRSSEPASTADAEAMAAATRKAVSDTDAALRDASIQPSRAKAEQTSE